MVVWRRCALVVGRMAPSDRGCRGQCRRACPLRARPEQFVRLRPRRRRGGAGRVDPRSCAPTRCRCRPGREDVVGEHDQVDQPRSAGLVRRTWLVGLLRQACHRLGLKSRTRGGETAAHGRSDGTASISSGRGRGRTPDGASRLGAPQGRTGGRRRRARSPVPPSPLHCPPSRRRPTCTFDEQVVLAARPSDITTCPLGSGSRRLARASQRFAAASPTEPSQTDAASAACRWWRGAGPGRSRPVPR